MLIIGKTKEEDLASIYEISKEAFGEESWTMQQFKEETNLENRIFLKCEKNSQVVGFLIAQNLIDSVNILLIATKKSSQKAGYASLMLKQLEAICLGLGIFSIWLEVKENNFGAIKFYIKNGFTQISTRKNYYKDKCSALILSKNLPF